MNLGHNTTISFDSGFFAEIHDITPPSASREDIETTHMETTVARTFKPSALVDWGECEIKGAFAPGTRPPIDTAAEAAVITWDDGTTWSFQAYMKNFKPEVPLDKGMTFTATLKVTGDVTVSAGSSAP